MGKESQKKRQRRNNPKLLDNDPKRNPNMIALNRAPAQPFQSDAEDNEAKPKKMSLLDDDDADNFGEAAPSSKLSVNELFAQHYEEQKRAEEQKRLEEIYGKTLLEESDSDESEVEEDEVGELVTPAVDAQIMRTISLIRSKKPEVYDPQVNFFDDEEIEKARVAWEEKRKEAKKSKDKPVTLRDMQRQQILDKIKKGEDARSDDDDDDDDDGRPEQQLTLAEEQELLRREFKAAMGDEDDDDDNDGFLKQRKRTATEIEAEEEDYKNFLLENMAADGISGLSEWKRYSKGNKDADATPADPNEAFLMNYILNRGWVDKDDGRTPTYDEIVENEHIDVEKEDEIDRFEKTYNFRFEEEGGSELVTYARDIEGVRRKDTRRSDARKTAKERKEAEKKKQEEDLRRLKNLKRSEIEERLRRIAEVAGEDIENLEGLDLEGDFDPEAFDKMMREKFNDGYYSKNDDAFEVEADEHELEGLIDDDDNDDDGGLTLGDDDDDDLGVGIHDIDEGEFDIEGRIPGAPTAGIGKVRVKEQTPSVADEEDQVLIDDAVADDDDENFIMDADYLPGGALYGQESSKSSSKKDKKKAAAVAKKPKSLAKHLESLYDLDHEDTIAGNIKTRFRYRQVEPDTFGLSMTEILVAPTKALNQLVPLKHIAPYRPAEKVVRDKEIFSHVRKKRIYQVRRAIKEAEAPVQPKPEDYMEEEESKPTKKPKLGQAARKALQRKKKREAKAAEVEVVDAPGVSDSGNDDIMTDSSQQVMKKRKRGGNEDDDIVGVDDKNGQVEKSSVHVRENSNTGLKGKADGRSKKKKKMEKTMRKSGDAVISEDRLATYVLPSRKKK